MSTRAPSTLWFFLIVEVVRLLIISASVVVVVASFAVSVRFIANGTLGPLDALRLMGLAAIPMLQYALPFAGGFAATLAYHRMSQDNELTACYAGGVSHRTILMPAAILGAILGVALFAMADQAMPRLLRKMQELVTDDATRLLQAAIGRGQAIERGNQLLYADKLIERPPEPGSGAYKHFQLQGVVAVELDDKRAVKRELASPLALVWLFHDTISTADVAAQGGRWDATSNAREQVTRVVMRLKDPLAGRGETAIGEAEQTEVRFTLPSAFSDDPKYLSWSELAAAKARPEALNLVANPKRRLVTLVAQRAVAEQLGKELAQRGIMALTDPSGRSVVVRAAAIDPTPGPSGQALIPPAAPLPGAGVVEVTVAIDRDRTRTHRAARAFLAPNTAADVPGTALNLVLENVTTTSPGSAGTAATTGQSGEDTSGSLSELVLPALRPALDPIAELAALPVDSLLAAANARLNATATATSTPTSSPTPTPTPGGNPPANTTPALAKADPLIPATAQLARSVKDLRHEITSKQHERIAASLACVVMVLLGAVMGMKLGNAAPLIVYLWSFLPAIGSLVSIAAGQSITHTYGAVGLPVLYAGVLLLAVFTFTQYRIVAKH